MHDRTYVSLGMMPGLVQEKWAKCFGDMHPPQKSFLLRIYMEDVSQDTERIIAALPKR